MEHRAAHCTHPHPPFVYFKSWSSELYPGRKAPKHVGSQTSWNEACSCNGGRGEGCLKTPCTGTTVGKVYMCLFCFCKKGKPGKTERLRFISGFLQIKMAIIMELGLVSLSLLGYSGCADEQCVCFHVWIPRPAARSPRAC